MPANAEYADLLPRMLPEVPGVDENLALHHLRQAGRHFFKQSQGWVLELPSMNIVEDQRAYVLAPPYDVEILLVYQVRINSADGVSRGQKGTKLDESYWEFDPSVDQLTLAYQAKPSADITSGLEVDILAAPRVLDSAIDPAMIGRYQDGILGYALYTLKSQSQERWSDPQGASRWFNTYRGQKAAIRRDRQNRYKADQKGIEL